jgi:hypothetical protein
VIENRFAAGAARSSTARERFRARVQLLGTLIMRDDTKGPPDAETIRRIAREQVKLDLSDAEVEALQPVIKGLYEEIGRIQPEDRAGAEPDVMFGLEDWPHG